LKRVTLAHQTDFDGWRAAARSAVLAAVPPDQIVWRVGTDSAEDLFATEDIAEPGLPSVDRPAFTVSRTFVALAKELILHRDPGRFSLMYRLLWRLRQEPHLLADASDPDVHLAHTMTKSIHRDIHKMHAFVRFKEIVAPDGEAAFIAWFEPDHYIIETTGPFFVRRFTGMRWSILTPDGSAFWDKVALRFGPGADKADVPDEDRLEAYWLTYYASIFNPARLKIDAMQKEMPKKYWKNLPEARMIEGLIRDAGTRMEAMIVAEPTTPSKRGSAVAKRDASALPSEPPQTVPTTLAEARVAAKSCRRCDLYGAATQVVFGEGPEDAEIMFVGEQPGDKEDLAGHPFVGPAGAMFNRALDEAGVDRARVYVTNAVKHFKYEPRGKVRLHKKPDGGEIQACRWWLDLERSFLKPKLIVALGASAGQGLLGRTVRVNAERGKPMTMQDGAPVFLTVHPSYLLRLPDAEAKAREYARFVDDLRAVRTVVYG
jgi:probable DNA metabolism protein